MEKKNKLTKAARHAIETYFAVVLSKDNDPVAELTEHFRKHRLDRISGTKKMIEEFGAYVTELRGSAESDESEIAVY